MEVLRTGSQFFTILCGRLLWTAPNLLGHEDSQKVLADNELKIKPKFREVLPKFVITWLHQKTHLHRVLS